MTRLLLASHAGESSIGAVRVAPLLAARLHAELDVVSVVPTVQPMDYGFGVLYAGPEQEARLGEREAADLEALLARCGVSGCTPAVRYGQPAIEIAAAARASAASLILVGLGPHHALDRALGGETALQLVQVASTPVLAVPADATSLPRRVVAGIDFTPSSVLAARTAARLLADGDAMHLVYVRAPGEARARMAQGGAGAPPRDVGRELGELATQLGLASGVAVSHAVVEGPPSQALLNELTRTGGDLIALGSHGYGLWKRLTIGSVASKILRVATTSVLVAPIGSVNAPITVAASAAG